MELIIKKIEELSLEELYEIMRVRVSVFVVEQKCPYPELDGYDLKAYHLILRENGKIKAYLRVLDGGTLFEEVSIGRVLTTERGKGFGGEILQEGIKVARSAYGAKKIIVAAQTYAKNFYGKYGFKPISEEYVEDGIPHVKMLLTAD